jgi:hypothetical protein
MEIQKATRKFLSPVAFFLYGTASSREPIYLIQSILFFAFYRLCWKKNHSS